MFICPSLFLWVVAYPMILLWSMVYLKNKEKLHANKGTIVFGYIFKGYKKNHYYWEFTKVFLRFVIVICVELIIV